MEPYHRRHREQSRFKRSHHGSQENPILLDEAVESPRKRRRHSPRIYSPTTLSQLPTEILNQIMSEVPDRRGLLSLCLASKAFYNMFKNKSFELVRSAHIKEVEQRAYHPSHVASTISNHKRHTKEVLMLFEVTWDGLIMKGDLANANTFIRRLREYGTPQYHILLELLQTKYDKKVPEMSWNGWASAFTAVDALVWANHYQQQHRRDDIGEMQNWLLHEAVCRRREIISLSTSKVGWDIAYFVLEEIRVRLTSPPVAISNDNDVAEVIQAILVLAIDKQLWHEAHLQVLKLLKLGFNINVDNLVGNIRAICCGAISANNWYDATTAMDIFLNYKIFWDIPGTGVVCCVDSAISDIHKMWRTAIGTRWDSSHRLFDYCTY
ncbi:hypothetical protein V492_00372 [Pseudogymnoascus sp. VKM F-4246]|nr:hypothetical protein V492_00372 [Pseudogymnoascus sp. VKM F-4246]